MTKRILYVTYDKQSFTNRSGALLQSGFTVNSPRSATDAIPLVASGEFFCVVVGNSVLRVDREHIIRNIRKLKPDQPIIYVTNQPGDHDTEADESVDVSQDFGKLLTALQRIESSDALKNRRGHASGL